MLKTKRKFNYRGRFEKNTPPSIPNLNRVIFYQKTLIKFLNFIDEVGETEYKWIYFSNSDECMFYDALNNIVTFNLKVLDKQDLAFSKIWILHEAYHLFQGIPNKNEVKIIKDKFGSLLLNQIDVESDLEVVKFLKYINSETTFKDYLKVFYNSGKDAFHDDELIESKFERWIGSKISILDFFKNASERIYVPKLTSVCSLLLSINDKGKEKFQIIKVSHEEVKKLSTLFQSKSNFDKKTYTLEMEAIFSKILLKIRGS